jgi:hypothetical protein
VNKEESVLDEASFNKEHSGLKSQVLFENDNGVRSAIRLYHRLFFEIAENPGEYRQDFFPSDELVSKLKAASVDVLAFRREVGVLIGLIWSFLVRGSIEIT